MKSVLKSLGVMCLACFGCANVLLVHAQPTSDIVGRYVRGDDRTRREIAGELPQSGETGLPVLEQLLGPAPWVDGLRQSREQRSRLLDAVGRVGTDRALDCLQARAERNDPDAMTALARAGTKGLDRVVKLSMQTETYREPWFAPEWREPKFVWFPKKQTRPTAVARLACGAVASVADPAAVPVLAELVGSPEMCNAALQALASMKAPGIEEKAVRIWEANRNPAALKYLLAVNRQRYLPVLQEELKALDDEVARLLGDLEGLRARGVRDFPSDDSVVHLVFDLGGDPAANATLRRYIESRLWDRCQRSTVAFAVLALGLSRATDARPTLVDLLKDSTPLDVANGLPFSRYRLEGSGRGSGVPMFIVAAKALQELGDPSVVPVMEQHEAVNDPLFRRCFEEVLSTLRAASKANQVPEDTAHGLADPQH